MQAKKTLDNNSLIERNARIKSRLDELREFAADEGESLNEASIEDFLSLMRENESFRAPYIFSNYEGEISISWQEEKRLSVVFFGNDITELTFYKEVSKTFVSLPTVHKLHISQTRDFIKKQDFCLMYNVNLRAELYKNNGFKKNNKDEIEVKMQSLVA